MVKHGGTLRLIHLYKAHLRDNTQLLSRLPLYVAGTNELLTNVLDKRAATAEEFAPRVKLACCQNVTLTKGGSLSVIWRSSAVRKYIPYSAKNSENLPQRTVTEQETAIITLMLILEKFKTRW